MFQLCFRPSLAGQMVHRGITRTIQSCFCIEVIFCRAGVSTEAEKAWATMSRLQDDLLSNYNENVMPISSLGEALNVTLGLSVLRFNMVSRRPIGSDVDDSGRLSRRRTRPTARRSSAPSAAQ